MQQENFQTYLTEPEAESKSVKKQGIWELLASMKFAIWILVAMGVLSVVGLFANELKPQDMSGEGGGAGRALLTLFQFADPFRSWWYRLLLGLLCLSLFACVVQRFPVIWRLWTKKPPEDGEWLKHVRTGIVRDVKISREKLESLFGGLWTWRLKNDKLWVAEHGRVGMWGPLLMHLGMLLIVVGALVGSFGGSDDHLGGYAGDIITMPSMPFGMRIDSFRVTYYPLQRGQWVQVDGQWVGKLDQKQPDGTWLVQEFDENREMTGVQAVQAVRIRNHFGNDMDRSNIKRYSSYVTVIENDREVYKTEIAVNSPLRRAGFRAYQSSYEPETPRVSTTFDGATIVYTDTLTGKSDSLFVRLGTEAVIPGDTLRVKVLQYLPHFKLGKGGAYSESTEPVNPAVNLQVSGAKGFSQTRWLFQKFSAQAGGPGRYIFRVADVKNPRTNVEMKTILEIKRSHGSAILWLGFFFCTVGLILCFYLFHRVLYVQWPVDANAPVRLTGLSRKTGELFAQQLDRMLKDLS